METALPTDSSSTSIPNLKIGTLTTTDCLTDGSGSTAWTRFHPQETTAPLGILMAMLSPISTSTSTQSRQDGTCPRLPQCWIMECGGMVLCQQGIGTRRAPCRLSREPVQTERTRTRWVTFVMMGWTTTRTDWSTLSTTTATVTQTAAVTMTMVTVPLTKIQMAGTLMVMVCPTHGRLPTTSTQPQTPTWTAPMVTLTETDWVICWNMSILLGGLVTVLPLHQPSTSGQGHST